MTKEIGPAPMDLLDLLVEDELQVLNNVLA